MRRVVVTGLGAVTPLGICVKDTWKRLIAGDCGIVNIQSHLDDDRFNGIPSKIAGLVPGFKPSAYVSIDARRMARFTQLALAAAEEALTDSGMSLQSAALKESTGVCIGSGIGSFEDAYDTSIKFHQQGYHKVSPLFIPRLLTNMAAGHMSIHFGFQGPSHTVSTACTTGAHAIGDASRFISHGDANVMVAGASESCIHPLALAGFARSRSLSTSFNEEPTQASRPFDAARDGFVIAEGAGIMVLEEREHALRRDARVYAEVRGYGLSSDASHLIAPHPQGEGAFLSMTRAINDARLSPAEIDYVNAHATSTRLGDRVENDAIKRVLLGPGGKSSADQLNISSTKGATGHLLGAAGAVEALFTVLSLYNGMLPPTINLHDLEPSGFDCNYIANTAQMLPVRAALCNSFGFAKLLDLKRVDTWDRQETMTLVAGEVAIDASVSACWQGLSEASMNSIL